MKSNTISIALVALALLLLAGVIAMKPLYQTHGAAFTGQAAYLQIATTTVVGPQDITDTIFSARTDGSCKARIVSTTGGSAIMLVFGDPANGDLSSSTVSGTVGHWQAASTTVAYDSGLYGCGRWSAYSYATQTITVSEF